MNKKILFLTPDLPQGGAEMLLSSIVNATNMNENDVTLVSLGQRTTTLRHFRKGITFKKFPRRKRFELGPLRKLRSTMLELRPDVVFCINYFTYVYARIASMGLRIPCRFLISYHTTIHVNLKDHFLHQVFTRLVRHKDEVIMTTQRQLEYTARHFAVPEGRVRIIYNGVDNQYWSSADKAFDPSETRASLGIPEAAKLIIMVATFRPEKNHEAAVEALRILTRKKMVDAHILFVGTGPEITRIRAIAMNSGVNSRIHFAGYTNDIRPLYWASDLFTLTSKSVETFSIAALEAMSSGLPAVLTNIGGASEMVFNGQNGFLCDVNPQDISDKWEKALNHTFSRKDIQVLMKDNFNRDRMNREYLDALGLN